MSTLFGESLPETAPDQTPYRVLARKYRPSTFAELIGQEAMVRTLTNAIQSGRLPQAWMLTGVRGIGKTTTARIIAKALNCTGRDAASAGIEPCGRCDACTAIAEDRHVDVQEMDAASRTSVDDIREIVDGVRYGPVSAKYKVYILDEVHMLSKNAFNALLKTLEEPPPHTKFIFATTEIRKVPVTVLSRCQRFDLRRIESGQLETHFMTIAGKEDVSAEEEAIRLIAHAAEGSVRDGLSLLDQAIALGNGSVTEADVKAMLGLADRAAGLSLCRALMRGEMKTALATYHDMIQMGTDPVQILQDLAEVIHRLTRAQVLGEEAQVAALPESERTLISDLSEIKIPALARAWQIVLKGLSEVQSAPRPDSAAEMVLIRLAYASDLPTPADLIKQVRDQKDSGSSSASSDGAPSGNSGPSARVSRFGSPASSRGAVRLVQEGQEVLVDAVAQQKTMPAMPQTFRELVALFATHREGNLYAELCMYAHPVRFAQGRLEIRLEPAASPQLVPRAMQCLQSWTEQRWVITLVEEEGGPTLAQEDKERERLRQEKVEAHPLMSGVRSVFPQARLVSLKAKEKVDVSMQPDDGVEAAIPDEVMTD